MTPPTSSQDVWQSNIPSQTGFQEEEEKKGDEEEAVVTEDVVGNDERTGSHSGDPEVTPDYLYLLFQEIQKKVGSVQEEVKTKLEEIAKFVGMHKSPEQSPEQWQKIGEQDQLVPGPPKETTVFKLPEDAYSILASWEWKTKPFLIAALVVIGLQIVILVLLIFDVLGTNDWTDNPLGVPVNVRVPVRIAQFLATIISLFSQDDLRVAIAGIFQGVPFAFKGDKDFHEMTSLQWYISCFLRFIQGFFRLFASFMMIMQAETVFDLLLNFLGVAFISELDGRLIGAIRPCYFIFSAGACCSSIMIVNLRHILVAGSLRFNF